LGYGLAALGWRWRGVLLTAALLSVSIELYQALFTDRVCAPRDLAGNALGAAVGAAVLFLIRGGPKTQPQASDRTRQTEHAPR
jgi:glycopeptide antibiotics resistance protein